MSDWSEIKELWTVKKGDVYEFSGGDQLILENPNVIEKRTVKGTVELDLDPAVMPDEDIYLKFDVGKEQVALGFIGSAGIEKMKSVKLGPGDKKTISAYSDRNKILYNLRITTAPKDADPPTGFELDKRDPDTTDADDGVPGIDGWAYLSDHIWEIVGIVIAIIGVLVAYYYIRGGGGI